MAIKSNDYQSISIIKVMPPEWPEFLLSTYIPHCEHHVLILNFLHIETYILPENDQLKSIWSSIRHINIHSIIHVQYDQLLTMHKIMKDLEVNATNEI